MGKKTTPKVRNFVAKNAQESGAGRHKDKKKDYKRQPKHRKQVDVTAKDDSPSPSLSSS